MQPTLQEKDPVSKTKSYGLFLPLKKPPQIVDMSANGSNRFLNIEDANLRVRSGNVHAKGITVGGITVGASHGLQRVSDVSNTTSNTLQFTNATTSFKATSNIEVGGDVSYTSKPKISVESNVVAEYTGPHDRPLRKYPEIILPRSAVGTEYNGYRIDRSSEHVTSGYAGVHMAFSETAVDFTDSWGAGINGTNFSYSASTGEHTAYLTGGTTQGTAARLASNVPNGEWVSLKNPVGIKLDDVELRSRNASDWYSQYPTDFQFWGSNDGTTWSHIKTFTGQSANGQSTLHRYHINSTIFYNRHALVVTKIPGTASTIIVSSAERHFHLSEIRFNGREEGSASLDTTLKSVYNVPATTGTQLEVYYDAKDLTTMPNNVTDLAGGDQTGTPYNVTLDSTTKSFVFNGSSSYINSGTTPISGNQHHSFSCWLKPTSGNTNYRGIGYIFHSGSNNTTTGLFLKDGKPVFLTWGTNFEPDYTLPENEWVHVTAVYDGTGRTIYINSKNIGSDTYSSYTINASANLYIGASSATPGEVYNGSIANFRLYSKALNADQIKELYDYQKDYFLGSKSQVTLYKGHLGVGVTEPSGQLELAGDERIQEYPPRGMTANETLVEGHGAFVTHGGHSNAAYAPWRAFNKELGSAGNFWIDTGIGYSDVAPYGPLSTHSKTTLYDGSVLSGGWIDLECPYPIKLKRVGTAPRTNYSSIGLQRGVILGSDNGVDWYQVDTIDYAGTTPPNSLTYFDINTESYYSHFRLVCTNLTTRYPASGTSDMHWQMGELVYFGTPGPTTLDKGSLTLGRSLDVPRVSRYDVDTETPRPEKLVLDFDTTVNSSPTDISGQGNHGTFKGTASYSPAEKAFFFDGNSDYIQGTLNLNGSELDGSYTLSAWVKRSSTSTSNDESFLFYIGTDGTGDSIGFYSDSETSYKLFHYNATTAYATSQPSILNTYRHIVATYDGTYRRIYIDGVMIDVTNTGVSAPLGIPNNPTFSLGMRYTNLGDSMEYLHGYMSNPKIYSVALEPSEVKKLYNLGRTGRSMVISDTAVGIGKVPEAQLDVRGNLNVDGVVRPYTCAFSAYASSGGNSSATGVFPADGVHFDIGNCYDASTYEFTAPVYGIYHMSWSAYTNQAATTTSRIFAYQSNNMVEQKGHTIEKHGNSLSLTVRMQAGETFNFRGSASYPIYYYGANVHNRFSGHLICAL